MNGSGPFFCRKVFFLCLLVLLAITASQPAFAAPPAVTTATTIATIAGTGSIGYSGDGSPAIMASISPANVAVDAVGNVYIADRNNQVIRKIDTNGIITTVAGNGTIGYSGDGGAATLAQLNYPTDVVVDSSGNLYIADTYNGLIRKVDTFGTISTIAGRPNSPGYSGDNGLATSAQLTLPTALALDAAGNLYLNDDNNYVVRKINASGVISTVVGTSAQLYNTYALTTDSAGTLYIADTEHCRVLKLVGSTVTTIAGIGTPGNSNCGESGDGGAATSAQIDQIYGMAFDASGNLYLAGGNVIREINTGGTISTVTGNGGSVHGGDGGPLLSAQLNGPQGIAFDASGNLYIAENGSNYLRKAGTSVALAFPSVRISPIAGYTQQVPLSINQALTITAISVPPSVGGAQDYTVGTVQGCTADGATQQAAGTTCTVPVTFSPRYPGSRSVPLQVTTSAGTFSFPLTGIGLGSQTAFIPGTITTAVGTGTRGYSGTSAATAQLSQPMAVRTDAMGNLYIADAGNYAIRKVNAATGAITTVAGTGVAGYSLDGVAAASSPIRSPWDIAVDGAGNIYIAEPETDSIRKVDAASGILSTYAGTHLTAGYSGDGGTATAAKLSGVFSLALDKAGNLYFSDLTYNVVRRVDAKTGIITTVAGNGNRGYYGDFGPATSAQLAAPQNVVVDSSGNLYIADAGNYVIRKVDTKGIISTIAGDAGTAGNHNTNSPASGEFFNYPNGLTTDAGGNLYIADSGTGTVLKLDTNQQVIIAAGPGGPVGSAAEGYSGDGGPATSALFNLPISFGLGIAVDSAGNLFIPDAGNNVVRKVAAATASLAFPSTQVGASSSSQKVSISNTGNTVLNFGAINASTGFTVDSSSSCITANLVNPGGTCDINVIFTPQTAGTVTGTVTITDDALNIPEIPVSTQQITLTGGSTGSLVSTLIQLTGPSSVPAGQNATFTATVVAGSGSGTPTGSVTFTDGATTLATVQVNGSGVATYSTSTLTAGSHTIQAIYSGDSSFAASQPASLTVTVSTLAPTVVTLQGSSTVTIGQSTTFTATVAPGSGNGMPTGTITFKDGTTTLATVQVTSGVATYTTSTLTIGQHTLTAVYNGDSSFAASQPASVTVAVAGTPTVATLSGPVSFVGGKSAVYTVKVTTSGSGTPSGTVTLSDGATTLATLNLDGTASATYNANTLTIGQHTLTAIYSGDNNFAASQPVSITITVTARAATFIVLTGSGTITAGQSSTYTAKVQSTESGTPTGTVTFSEGTTTLATVTIDASATATYTTPTTLTAGTHTLLAAYNGDSNFAPSQPVAATITVTSPASPDFTLTANPSTLTLKQGQRGQSTFTLTPLNGFTGTTTFACTGLPAGANCAFNPATLSVSGTSAASSVLTISTTGPNGAIASNRHEMLPNEPLAAGLLWIPSALFGTLLCIYRRKLNLGMRRLFVLLTLTGITLAVIGCSGGGSSTVSNTTSAGNYQVSVTASASGTGSGSHTAAFTLTVTQ